MKVVGVVPLFILVCCYHGAVTGAAASFHRAHYSLARPRAGSAGALHGRSAAATTSQLHPALHAQDESSGHRDRKSRLSFALSSLDATSSASPFDDIRNATSVEAEAAQSASLGSVSPSDSASETSSAPAVSVSAGNKLRRLKDMMWVRETLEDLTAAEFACTVEAEGTDDDEHDAKRRSKRSRKRAVDYEKLLNQLNKRIGDLGCESIMTSSNTDAEAAANFQCDLEPGTGMGSLTYSDTQRAALLQRLVRTRMVLIQVIHGNKIDMVNSENIPFLQMQMPQLPTLPQIPKEEVEDALSPKLYVRDDGTVDWDGALTSGAALGKFGTAVWARINGRDSDSVDDGSVLAANASATGNQAASKTSKPVTAKIVETPQIIEARQKLVTLSSQLVEMEKEHYKLLNSAISQGQATANVKLAALEPQLRNRIQASAVALDNIKVRVSYQTLLYELERIYTYLVGELGNPAMNGYIPLQDRLNVAEFGLLESQVDSFNRQFDENESVDEDVLAVVFEQLTDFKRRLGIDYYVAGLSFDREAIGRWLGELWVKTKKGLTFYVKGVRLLWNDLVFCLRLINRAAQGYTLKPREVRTLRYVQVIARTRSTR